MDHIKVKLRSPNKRSLKRISRNQWLDFPSRHKVQTMDERFRISRTQFDVQSPCLKSKGFSGFTLQDYIRGSSPPHTSPDTKVVRLALKQVKLNFPRRTQIEEIDQDDYDQSLNHKQYMDNSLPKIQRFFAPNKQNLKIRSSSRVEHNPDQFTSMREERVRTVYNEPLFLNAHKSVSAKRTLKDPPFLTRVDNSKTEKFARFKLDSPYLATSAGFMVGLAKKKGRKIMRSGFRHGD